MYCLHIRMIFRARSDVIYLSKTNLISDNACVIRQPLLHKSGPIELANGHVLFWAASGEVFGERTAGRVGNQDRLELVMLEGIRVAEYLVPMSETMAI